MKGKKWVFLISIFILVILVASVFWFKGTRNQQEVNEYQEIKIERQDFKKFVETIGIVAPQNRVRVMPPISGRLDVVLVEEGDMVREGQPLAWMSSTERAALLDTAKTQGKEKVRYWSNVYKATPLLAPVKGKVIVRNADPGQTVNTSSEILVLADKLIVKAQVDETDIGKVELTQKAKIALDAYPEIEIEGKVTQISYEAIVINNVTVYEVSIMPERVPEVFRSGMNANVEIMVENKKNVLVIPRKALQFDNEVTFVYIQKGVDLHKQSVKLGLANDDKVEILEGITDKDTVMIVDKPYLLQNGDDQRSFFMPKRKNNRKK
ncbi:HlyD family efflux transporter periplasmic adaptor subunit [bacterium]|nr:HlyD family efflux transporter periplasmic adaptor subunit [bacterium]MBT3581344.1 HlyD family efflux transporter periplasmic adaptor subunit [bacterium]MBT4552077.1 HlyD family efflux transporter periplasmic adaptor subunit [bacterium]MBT5989138.1 HlyD family efflux transporter periplasmic adaptor subunit [bacterium]MBT7088198.1 HlyD family efflux transporter periplasmic adaptor subunit [bacterium]